MSEQRGVHDMYAIEAMKSNVSPLKSLILSHQHTPQPLMAEEPLSLRFERLLGIYVCYADAASPHVQGSTIV